MIANLGPADYNFDETMSTLRYANRAKNIKNKPKINEDPKDAMLREFQEEIARLKAQLGEGDGAGRTWTRADGSFDGDGGDGFVEKTLSRGGPRRRSARLSQTRGAGGDGRARQVRDVRS